jgi:subtilase family serine protease
MKKIFFITTLLIGAATAIAQNPQLPDRRPAPQNPRLLSPPDLKVEELSLVSVVRNEAVKKINIQVLIRVKNVGELRCGASTVVAYMKSPAGTGSTRTLAVSLPVTAINPGESFVKVYTFQEAESAFRPGNFDFWIKADARNAITESNETNNTSTTISIAVPAR